MADDANLITVITGAGGFVGQALAARMASSGYPGRVRLVDRAPPPCPPGAFTSIAADLTDWATLAEVIAGADRIVHLAALAGGAAQRDPAASRAINLDSTRHLLALVEPEVRLVCAGSIAVFGDPLPDRVQDDTPPRPASVYGSHKHQAETAIVDAVRRDGIDAIVLRLPGIVARPRGANGFKSAFMSDVVSAFAADDTCTVPVGPDATMWLMSAGCCADNLLHALTMPRADAPVVTLPALRLTMRDYVTALATASGRTTGRIRYAPDAATEAAFGRLPPLITAMADVLGFRHDGDAATLAAHALAGLKMARRP